MTAIPPQPTPASREAEDDPNAFLFDDAVERASLWERYKVALWLAVLQLWRPWRRKIGERTRSGVERIASRGIRATETKAFEALLGRQADAVDKAFAEIRALMKQELREAAIIEAQATKAGMQAALPQVQLGELTEGAANRVVAQRPFEGRVLKKHFDRLSADTKDALERAVRQGLVNGESAAQIAARVTADVGGTLTMSTRNLEVTVKTAVTAATNAARFEALREMRQHIQRAFWVATLDSSTCVICAPLDGTTIDLDNPAAALPPEHYSCLPGDARVDPIGNIRAVTGREYEGDLVVIHTASGLNLSCTPNHPILTEHGWVPAGSLNVGDHVVRKSGGDIGQPAVSDADGQNVPPRIHEVAEAIRSSRSVVAVEMPSSTPDFHGDGMEGQVTTVWANSSLDPWLMPALLKKGGKLRFVGADVPLACCPSHRHALDALARHALPDLDSGLRKDSVDGLPADAESLCYPENGLSTGVGIDDLLLGKLVAVPVLDNSSLPQDAPDAGGPDAKAAPDDDGGLAIGVAPNDLAVVDVGLVAARPESGFAEPRVYDAWRDTDRLGDVRDSLPFEVSLDEIVSVDRDTFHGPVFNLETDSGAYIANGIVIHNCRCTFSIQIAGAPAGERASVNGPVPGDMTYDDWLRLQPAAVQNRVLGKGRAQLWRDGKLGGLNPLVLLDANRRPVPLKVLRERLERRRRRT